jgi:hypothetical protein
VDRALWLLLALRFHGWLRRFGRSMRSVKGVLLTLVGLLFLVPWLVSTFMPQPGGAAAQFELVHHLESVRRFGPMVIFTYCLLSLFLSTGERAIYFSPAEVNFLFPAPFSRRQLLGYKIVTSLGLTVISALFMTAFLNRHAAWPVAAYVGLVLALMFLQLFSMMVALVSSTLGVLAFTWRRRLVLGRLAALAVAGLWQVGRGAFEMSPVQLLARAEQSPLVQVVLAPFRWFVLAYTAERLWPDLVQWSALALMVDISLVVFVLALDAQYLESSSAASARIYALIEQRRRGGSSVTLRRPGKVRFSLPSLPSWGGVGPIAWRQLTCVARSPGRLLLILFLLTIMGAPLVVGMSQVRQRPELLRIGAAVTFLIGFYLTHLLPFDFRADIDRMAELKALPIAPSMMVLGQLVTPLAFVTLMQWSILLGMAAAAGRGEPLIWAAAAMAMPVNVILLEIENAVFLWFPTRTAAVSPGDIQTMGRVIVLMMAKLVCLGLAALTAGLAAAAAYYLSGHNEAAAIAAAWLVLTGEAIGLVPLVALAFQRFDVARDVPP